nr:MAG TPA: hypothetical protein [Caudoviricetes sp.]
MRKRLAGKKNCCIFAGTRERKITAVSIFVLE